MKTMKFMITALMLSIMVIVSVSLAGKADETLTNAKVEARNSGIYDNTTKASQVNALKGRCDTDESHIAHGTIGEDIRGSRVSFKCDSVVLAWYGQQHRYLKLIFTQSKVDNSPMLVYYGFLDDSGTVLNLVYEYKNGKAIEPLNGACEFEIRGTVLESIDCFSVLDQGEKRTVSTVSMKVFD